MAKEAAEEAKAFPEDSQILTGSDFKKFATLSCCMKWQRSWDAADTGRHLYDYKPKVSLKTPAYMFIPFIEKKKNGDLTVETWVRFLNEYRHKVGLLLWFIFMCYNIYNVCLLHDFVATLRLSALPSALYFVLSKLAL